MDPIIDSDALDAFRDGRFSKLQKNIIVLGGSGMLGGYFLEFICELVRLQGSSIKIIACVRNQNKYLSVLENHYRDSLTLVQLSEIKSTIENGSDWLVFHAASPASPESQLEDFKGLVDSNIELNLLLAKSLSKVGGHLVFLSSGEVYGPNPKTPTKESDFSGIDHLTARGAYAEAKRAGELILHSYSRVYGLNASVLRIYHTFGPGINLNESRIFSTIIKSIVESSPIKLRTSGMSTRAFLYSSDLVFAALICCESDGFKVVNVAGKKETTILEFATVASRIGNIELVFCGEGEKSLRRDLFVPESPVKRGFADTNCLEQLGWKQCVPIEQAIIKTSESARWRALHGY